MTNEGSDAEFVARLQPRHRKAVLASLSDQEQRAIFHHWPFWARPEQMPPDGNWSVWLIMAGRGFGKTRAGAEWVRSIAESDGSARFALVGANYAETRTVMVEGESGLLSIAPPQQRPVWEPSLKRLSWASGAQAYLYSAAEPEGLRGPQHSHSWCDEIAKWMNNSGQAEAAWDNLKMGLRLGFRPQIVATTTPRPVALVRELVGAEDVVISRGRTQDNDLHLPEAFLTAMAADYGGTRLGRQELDGELIEDLEGALWTRAMIEGCRVGGVRVERSRDTGARPNRSLDCARDERGAGLVRMVKSVLHAAKISLPVRLVHAARGKVARAEPVAALYENGRVHHVGAFPRLEDELCGLLIGGGYAGPGRSPDRADALVWALTELMLGTERVPRVR